MEKISNKELFGRKYLIKLGKIDRFLTSSRPNIVYTVDDIQVGDLTNRDLEYMNEVSDYNFKHTCGVIKFYEKF